MSECQSCPSNGNCDGIESCTMVGNPENRIGKIIGVMSGKGGVGKSTVSTLLSRELRSQGYRVGLLDADITGPSIPRLLGISGERVYSRGENTLIPAETPEGIKVMSLNLMVKEESDPVIWRGPMIGEMVKQFYTDVIWGELDYLVIDMPPGTGDVALTTMQSIPLSGIVMVSIPQDLVSMIVSKAVNMARKMNIEVLGLVQNMSYILCPDCSTEIRMFESHESDKFLESMNLKVLGELPMTRDLNKISEGNLSDKISNTVSEMTNSVIAELNR